MRCSRIAALAAGAAIASFALPATAAQVLNIDMAFQSGATFDGAVTFSDDFSVIQDVSGILNGYAPVVDALYDPATSTNITWVWDSANYASGTGTYGNLLLDGVDASEFYNSIFFVYDYTSAPSVTFVSGSSPTLGAYNSVNGTDMLVSGTISAIPEPATWLTLIAGFGLIGVSLRVAKRRQRLTVCYS